VTCNRASSASTGALVVRFTGVMLIGSLTGGCHLAQQASPATTTSGAAPTSQAVPAVVNIAPLPVRPVQKSQPTTPDKCPATNPNGPIPSANVLIACDLARTTLYTLGPESMQLGLTQVDPPKLLTSDFYEVNLRMNPSSATAWASFTAAHPHAYIAFIRDDLVLEAPIIEELVTSGQVALTTQAARSAGQLAQLAGLPA
jgi:hypothetical protein